MAVPTILSSVTGQQVNLQLFNESDFILSNILSWTAWKAIMAASGGSVSQEIKCNFRDTSSDRNFFNQNLALRLVVGSTYSLNVTGGVYVPYCAVPYGQYRWVKPLFIRRNGMIQGTFDNLSTSATGAFPIIFEGARIFDAS